MRRLLPAVAFLLLAACQQEPTFEERYEAAQAKVGTTAKTLDGEMIKADRAAEADSRALENAGRPRQQGATAPAP